MTVAVRPLYDRVLVKRLEKESVSAGGIIIPDTAQEQTQFGAVVEVGTGKLMTDGTTRPLLVKKGDKILFGKYAGTEFKLDNEEYLVLKEEELLAILEK